MIPSQKMPKICHVNFYKKAWCKKKKLYGFKSKFELIYICIITMISFKWFLVFTFTLKGGATIKRLVQNKGGGR
jgi:hypothetical protein